jgi:amino acid adenylation domain-containing protein
MKFLINHVIEENLKNSTDAIAIQQGKETYTYGDVQNLANKFVLHFQSLGLKKGDNIGLVSRVRFETIAAMIAALRCGVIYIPLNIHAPASWIENVVRVAQIKHLIVDPQFSAKVITAQMDKADFVTMLDENYKLGFNLNDIRNFEGNPRLNENILADDIAYILYTSGSTGNPKGIMLTHRNAVTFIEWMKIEFKVTTTDRIFSRAPLQFDLSVFDIFSTFSAGATLVIADLKKELSTDESVTLMRDEKITIVYTVPSAYISYLTKGGLERGIPSLRALLYAGEPFPTPYLRRVMQCLPETIVSNIYGPTETNIVTYFHLRVPPQSDEPIPIGKTVFDTEAYIVDENLNLVKDGTMGEILIRGGTVFVGYFNDAELTAKKLILSPFHKYPTYLCRTGDYGRRLADGNIAYHGRMDNMVKTRGYRVEIGEIESAISSYDGVDEVAVIAKHHEKYGNTLHAFISFSKSSGNIDLLIEYIKTKIPSYMVPFEFVKLDVLPKTSTGKVDRVGLTETLKRKAI